MHSFRVDDELWEAAKRAADANGETLTDANGETLTDVLRRSLQRYVRRHPTPPPLGTTPDA